MLEFESSGSFVEKLDPRTKMASVVLVSAGAIVADRWSALGLALLFVLICWKAARLSFRRHRLLAAVLGFVLVSSVLTQSVFYGTFRDHEVQGVLLEITSTDTPVVGRLAVTWDGIIHGTRIAVRLAVILLAAVLLPLTTHPADFMLSLVKLRVPFVFVMTFSLGFRFLPLLQRNLLQIRDAQRLRGIRPFGVTGLKTAVGTLAWTTLRTADHLALSLETRAFQPSAPRTSYRELRPGARDAFFLGASAALFLAMRFFP